MKYYLMAWNKFFQFTGRSRRSEYFWFVIINLVIIIGIALISVVFGPAAYEVGLGLLGLYSILILFPSLSLMARRFHDMNLSAWFILPFLLISAFIQTQVNSGLEPGTLTRAAAIVQLLIQITLCFFAGTPGPNKYGPDPKEISTPMPQTKQKQREETVEVALPKGKEPTPTKIPDDPFKGYDG